MDALAHILLSLLALLAAGGDTGPRAQRDATTADPQGVPFAISDDAAERASSDRSRPSAPRGRPRHLPASTPL